jgi:hypothetical protein
MKSPPPGWILENKKAAYRRRDRTAEGLIKEFNPQAALVSDIRAYYANVDVPRLGERLLALGCPGVDVATVRLFLSAWRDERGLSGLPIGPEVSGPLGNAYLIEVDEHIESAQAKVIRFTDDYVILDLESRHESDLIRLFDQALTPAGLTRASDKTFWFSDAELAVEHHRHELIAYLAGGGGVVSKLEARKLLQAALEDDSLDPRLIKFLLGRFISSEDPFAARLVLSDERIWSLDPLRCGEYMALILARHRIKDADHLLDGIQDQRDMDSIALCRLRAARSKAWGRAEGRLFQSVSGNTQRHELVRAEAAGASALTPMWNSNDAVDQAVSSIVPIQVRRALTGAFHLFPSNPADARGLKRIAKSHDSLNITAFWAGGSS